MSKYICCGGEEHDGDCHYRELESERNALKVRLGKLENIIRSHQHQQLGQTCNICEALSALDERGEA